MVAPIRMSEGKCFLAGYRDSATPDANPYAAIFTHLLCVRCAVAAAQAKLVAECPDGNDLPPPQNAPVLFGEYGNCRSKANLRPRSSVPAAAIAANPSNPILRIWL